MAREYKLRKPEKEVYFNDAGEYDPFGGPDAPWRSDPATDRQLRFLEFFGVAHRANITKGQASDLIGPIKSTVSQTEYEEWKLAGEPDISAWRCRNKLRIARVMFLIVWKLLKWGTVALLIYGLFHWLSSQSDESQSASEPVIQEAALPTGLSAVAAEKRALAKYPDLADPTSPLNHVFNAFVEQHRRNSPGIFNDPEWPTLIVKEAQDDIAHRTGADK
ncbi:MAG: hypothetical protein ABSE62_05135 [Chthoniobacteraceae bacterium]|jgi:hypothetical protein